MSARIFNQDIGDWDVSNVSNMGFMFNDARIFNQDIGDWDVSNVSNMGFMFNGARIFNQDISRWDVREVDDMSNMFVGANAFNQNLGAWYVDGDLSLSPTLGAGDEVTRFTAQNDYLINQTPAYLLGGSDASFFTLTFSGVLKIKAAPIAGKESYNIRISARGDDLFGTNNHRDLVMTSNERPKITSPNGGASPYEIRLPENIQTVTTIIVTDTDSLRYTLTNDDAELFEIIGKGNSRTLRFRNKYIPDYEKPLNSLGEVDPNADQEYSVLVTVADEVSIDTQEIRVTITPVSDLPPTDIRLSSIMVARDATANRRVGLLSVIDGDNDETHTYTLVGRRWRCRQLGVHN